MTPAFEQLQQVLRKLPGLGPRSAERLALHLFLEKPEKVGQLIQGLQNAQGRIQRCRHCGNITEEPECRICADPRRDSTVLCVVEQIPDLVALERSSVFKGRYHVLHGKLSPVHGVNAGDLNLETLKVRLASGAIQEIILALSNDIEGEATCHYLQEHLFKPFDVRVTRIGFGLPSGSGIGYADPVTLRSALEGRRGF
jgi:recombination protein RecR